MPDGPEIVCLCGSTRFADELIVANRDLTLAGAIVVAPGVLSDDRVLVVNQGGYVGESTRPEIAYARAAGKPVPLHRSCATGVRVSSSPAGPGSA